MLKLASLDDSKIDLMLFCVSGLTPSTRVSDFGVGTKGAARQSVARMYKQKQKRCPERLALLSEELDNLLHVAMRLGFPIDELDPKLRAACVQPGLSQAVEMSEGKNSPGDTNSSGAGDRHQCGPFPDTQPSKSASGDCSWPSPAGGARNQDPDTGDTTTMPAKALVDAQPPAPGAHGNVSWSIPEMRGGGCAPCNVDETQ